MDLNLIESAENLSVKQAKRILIVFVLIVILLILGLEIIEGQRQINSEKLSSRPEVEVKLPQPQYKKVNYDSYKQWEELFANYKVDNSGRLLEIPPVKIAEFPDNMAQINSIAKRKEIFFNIVAIGAYHANKRILEQRGKITQLANQYYVFGHLGAGSKRWLKEKFATYNVEQTDDWLNSIKKLKKRIDIIPLSIILAQAASESGWGTSRFATQANNIFGEWTFDPDEPGIVPKRRPADASYKIRKFSSIEAAINSYLLNLNTHFAYSKLREIRFELRRQGKKLDPLQLSAGLIKYSEKRGEYVEQINNIIKYNDLEEFDKLLRDLSTPDWN